MVRHEVAPDADVLNSIVLTLAGLDRCPAANGHLHRLARHCPIDHADRILTNGRRAGGAQVGVKLEALIFKPGVKHLPELHSVERARIVRCFEAGVVRHHRPAIPTSRHLGEHGGRQELWAKRPHRLPHNVAHRRHHRHHDMLGAPKGRRADLGGIRRASEGYAPLHAIP